MFLRVRPTQNEIDEFLGDCRQLSLSYETVGIANQSPNDFTVDEAQCRLGQGMEVFERAKIALTEWRQFDLGWVELHPRGASIQPGTIVAVLVHHLGIWSLNGCRVVYTVSEREPAAQFGFAYGTLTNHAERGEEIFEVSIDPVSQEVKYRIRAASKPRATLARIGYPFTRALQARFRHDSLKAMQRAADRKTSRNGPPRVLH